MKKETWIVSGIALLLIGLVYVRSTNKTTPQLTRTNQPSSLVTQTIKTKVKYSTEKSLSVKLGLQKKYIQPGYYDVHVKKGTVTDFSSYHQGQVIKNVEVPYHNGLEYLGNGEIKLIPSKFKQVSNVAGVYKFTNESGKYAIGTEISPGKYRIHLRTTQQHIRLQVGTVDKNDDGIVAYEMSENSKDKNITLKKDDYLNLWNDTDKWTLKDFQLDLTPIK